MEPVFTDPGASNGLGGCALGVLEESSRSLASQQLLPTSLLANFNYLLGYASIAFPKQHTNFPLMHNKYSNPRHNTSRERVVGERIAEV